jgi:hypothetical protein
LYKDIVIEYDPTTVDQDSLKTALAEKGYDIAQAPQLPTHPERTDDSSDWFKLQERVTETDLRDLEMSGDHRKY